jgi:Tfp pilus assembly protein PilN
VRAVNLIPAERRRGGPGGLGRSGGAAYVVLGGLGALAVLAVLWAVADHQTSDRRARAQRMTSDAAQAEVRAAALVPYRELADLRGAREQAISQLAVQRFDWAALMRQVAAAMPAGSWLIDLAGAVPGASAVTPGGSGGAPAPSAAAASAAPSTATSVQISGCAQGQVQVADIINRLRGIPGVSDVSLASSVKDRSRQPNRDTCPPLNPQFALAIAFGASTSQLGAAPGQPPAGVSPASSATPSPAMPSPATPSPAGASPAPSATPSPAASPARATPTAAGAP